MSVLQAIVAGFLAACGVIIAISATYQAIRSVRVRRARRRDA